MAQKRIEEIFKALAKKHDVPVYVIEEVYMSQFKMVKQTMNDLEFKTIKLPCWGKYVPSKTKLEKVDYSEKKKALEEKKLKNGSKDT